MKKLIILLAILSFVFLPVYVAFGQDNTSPGQSGNAPGQTGDTPGQSGNTPGQSGSTAPGQSGNTPGQGSSNNGGGQTGSLTPNGPTPQITGVAYDPQNGNLVYQYKQ